MRSRNVGMGRRAAAWVLALACAWAQAAAAGDVPQPEPEPEVIRAAALLDGWAGQGGYLEGARQELEAVLQRNPRSAPAHRELARYLIISGGLQGESFVPGTLDAALASLDRAIDIAPDYAGAHVLRGHVLTLMGRLEEADRALDRAAAIGTQDPWLVLNRATLRTKQKRPKEALGLCQQVSALDVAPRIRRAADHCLMDYYRQAGDDDQVEAGYRRILEYASDNAWSHGDYARFLLCTRDDLAAAKEQARAALAIMDYPHARATLAQALYREWAAQWNAGRGQQAQALFDEARAALDVPPESVIAEGCGSGKQRLEGLAALYRSGHLAPQSPADAIRRAKDADEYGTPGVFEVVVRGTGRDAQNTYANSIADYRDPDCLTVRFVGQAARAFAKRYGQPAEKLLMDKRIVVVGFVRREPIRYVREGRPTGHYFQTHLWVTEVAQVLDITEPGAARGQVAGVDR